VAQIKMLHPTRLAIAAAPIKAQANYVLLTNRSQCKFLIFNQNIFRHIGRQDILIQDIFLCEVMHNTLFTSRPSLQYLDRNKWNGSVTGFNDPPVTYISIDYLLHLQMMLHTGCITLASVKLRLTETVRYQVLGQKKIKSFVWSLRQQQASIITEQEAWVWHKHPAEYSRSNHLMTIRDMIINFQSHS
jgi:hypothetical protein